MGRAVERLVPTAHLSVLSEKLNALLKSYSYQRGNDPATFLAPIPLLGMSGESIAVR